MVGQPPQPKRKGIYMIKKIILTTFVMFFITACSEKPDDKELAQAYAAYKNVKDTTRKHLNLEEDRDPFIAIERGLKQSDLVTAFLRSAITNSPESGFVIENGSALDIVKQPEVESCAASPYGCIAINFQNKDGRPSNQLKLSYAIFDKQEDIYRGAVSYPLKLQIPTINPGEFSTVLVPIGVEGEWTQSESLKIIVVFPKGEWDYSTNIITTSSLAEAFPRFQNKENPNAWHVDPTEESFNAWPAQADEELAKIEPIIDSLVEFNNTLLEMDVNARTNFKIWSRSTRRLNNSFYRLHDALILLEQLPDSEKHPKLKQLDMLRGFTSGYSYK